MNRGPFVGGLRLTQPNEEAPYVADIYQALADSTRRSILDELSKREGQTLFELLGRLAMAHGITSSRQATSPATILASRARDPSAFRPRQ